MAWVDATDDNGTWYDESVGVWILAEGVWNDDGIWVDFPAIWLDAPRGEWSDEAEAGDGWTPATPDSNSWVDVTPDNGTWS